MICSHCKADRPEEDFNRDRRSKTGRRPECRECTSLRWYLLRYHLTEEAYLSIYERQNRACAVCETPLPITSLHLDHDHRCCSAQKRSCGRCVRGLLCSGCNRGLGFLGDSPKNLEAALAYIRKAEVVSEHGEE